MTRNSGTITAENRDRLPGRGRSNKTKILEALRKESFESLSEDATNDQCEVAFFRHIVRRIQDGVEDKDSGMLLKFLGDKGWSSMKPTLGSVEFDFDENLPPHEQASQVLAAAAKGHIAPDVAQMFVTSIANMLKINEITEIKDRLEALERMISEGKNV